MAIIFNTGDLTPDTPLTPDHTSWVYNGLDCCVTHEINSAIQLDSTTEATYRFSLSLQNPVLEMMLRGLPVSEGVRQGVIQKYRAQLAKLEAGFNRLCDEGVACPTNHRSPKQLLNLFYGRLNLKPILKRNANGRYTPTTDREALEKISSQHIYAAPFANFILAIRDIEKKLAFLESALDKDSRLRTNFNIAGTTTGRLSSSGNDFGTGTNVQNIDSDLRSTVVAPPGWKLCNIDLEQADARNVGAICWNLFVESGGPEFAGAYLDACESGDLHTYVCRMAWRDLDWPDDRSGWRMVADGVAYRGLTYRDLAKRLGHGTNYLGTPPTMAKHARVEQALIREFQARYFEAFPCIKAWHQWIADQLAREKQITTLMGRRRFTFERPTDPKTLREMTAYEPQSLTSDEVNTALLRLFSLPGIHLLNQVHDSILFLYREAEEQTVIPTALEAMRVTVPLKRGRQFTVPCEAKVGWNWGDVKYENGKPKSNIKGLVKWKGSDARTTLGSKAS